ncbi:MAG: 1-acyl-sn-glycerol-3-phosphate acyltransferase [Solirubrobacterales bacterium]
MGFGRLFSKAVFWISGWKTEGELPGGVTKCVLVAAPHTSNWDTLYSRCGLFILNVPARFALKKEWLRFPFKTFFEGIGAIAIDRSGGKNNVAVMVEILEKNGDLALMISPEGTRRGDGRWKTGFYQVAMQAKVPIVLAFLDYRRKIAGIGPTIYPTGDYVKDMQPVLAFYQTITPRNPEKFTMRIE